MTAPAISGHIPDLNLITWYAEHHRSWFSAVSPWTKGALLLLLVLLMSLTRNGLVIGSAFLMTLGLYASARLPLKKVFAWYLMPVVFVLSLAGLLAFTEPGSAVIALDLFGRAVILTDAGILLVVVLLLKALTVATWSLLFLMTTRYQHLAAMINRLFPAPLDQIFLMAYRFLFLTLSMSSSILKAVYARGGSLVRSVFRQGRLFSEVFALIFIRSFERSERVAKAMTARGFSGTYRTATGIPPMQVQDLLIIGSAACAILIAVLATGGGLL